MASRLQEAITYIKKGEKARGKELLIELLKHEPENDKAWVWMTTVVDTDKLRLECLVEALAINPQNQTAQKGIAHLRAKLEPEPILVSREEPRFAPAQQPYSEPQPEPLPEPELELETGALLVPEPASPANSGWSYEQYKPQPAPSSKPLRRHASSDPALEKLLSIPYFTIVIDPRQTVLNRILKNSTWEPILITAVFGWLQLLSSTFAALPLLPLPLAEMLPIVAIALLVGFVLMPIFTTLYLYISSFVLSLCGIPLGGQGTGRDLRSALAWGTVPAIYLSFIGGLIGFFTGLSGAAADPSDLAFSLPLLIVGLIGGIWSFYIQLQCIGAAHRFSAGRAFVTLLIPSIVIFLLFFVLALLAGLSGVLGI